MFFPETEVVFFRATPIPFMRKGKEKKDIYFWNILQGIEMSLCSSVTNTEQFKNDVTF